MSDKPTVRGAALGQHAVSFEGLLEAAPDAMAGVDQAGVIRFVNRQTDSLFGYDRTDLVGQSIETLVPESFRKVHPAHRAGYFADPTGTRARGVVREVTGRRRDGTEFPVDISLSFIDTEDGLLVIAAVRDVTERNKADQDLQQMAAIIRSSDAAIIGRTLDGIVTSWNPAAERMLGYSSEEIVGKSVEFLVPEDRTGEMNTILARVRAGQLVERFETIRVRKDGTVFPVAVTVAPIHDAGGAIIGASTFIRDVTEARQAFESARSMIESSLDSLVAISPKGKITDVNEATVKVTGTPRGELIGTAFSDYFTEPEKANEIYQRVFEQGTAVDYPLTMRHRDGTLTDVLYNASVYRDAGGKVLGVFAAARDVTELGQRIEAAQRLAAVVEFSGEAIVSTSSDGTVTSTSSWLHDWGLGCCVGHAVMAGDT
jgi:PAS domain S-box-containing protein